MGLCLSTMDSPKGTGRKRRKARPAPLRLAQKGSRYSRYGPPTPYPWRLRPASSLEPGGIVRSSRRRPPTTQIHSSTNAKIRNLRSSRGQSRLLNIQRTPSKLSNQPPKSGRRSPLEREGKDGKVGDRTCTQSDTGRRTIKSASDSPKACSVNVPPSAPH